MESCFYLRKDGSECKHFMFFKAEHSSVCALQQSHLQALTMHGDALLISLKLAFFSLASLSKQVPTHTPHLPSIALISDLPLPPHKKLPH